MNKQSSKKILVAGGAGFLGSHLIDKLIGNGEHVICIDNLHTGSKSNIEHHFMNSKFEFIEHDIVNPLDINVQEIYNLACPASPIHYQCDPIQTIKTNIYGAINLLDLAKDNEAKIFQASTSEVYGDPLVHPQVETYWGNVNATGLRSCYDEGKRCAETLFFDYSRQCGVRIKVARIFNTYGPRMDPNDGRVISNLVIQALKGDPITIYGNGTQTRSFCHVDDLVEVILKLMDSTDDFTGPVNVGNPAEFSIIELANKIINLTNSNSELIYKDLPSDDPTQRQPDISLAKKRLGWKPTIDLEEGLQKTISYFAKLI